MKPLRKCKCGTKAYDLEDLELFVKSKGSLYNRLNKCYVCHALIKRKSYGDGIRKSAPTGTYTTGKGQVIFSRYGVTEAEHKAKLIDQNYRCVICGSKEKLVIDHCHTTGNNRDILCSPCNSGLGMFKDNPKLMRLAAEYIEYHKV